MTIHGQYIVVGSVQRLVGEVYTHLYQVRMIELHLCCLGIFPSPFEGKTNAQKLYIDRLQRMIIGQHTTISGKRRLVRERFIPHQLAPGN